MMYAIALLVLAALLVCSAFVVLVAIARLEEIVPPAVGGEAGETDHRRADARANALARHVAPAVRERRAPYCP
jgi:hypothetical protein